MKITQKSFQLFLLLVISQNLFAQEKQEIRVISDAVYSHKDGMALTMDVYSPEQQNGAAVIFINSGGFRSPDFSRQCKSENGELWTVGNNKWTVVQKNGIVPELLQQTSFMRLLENGFVVFDVRHGSTPKYMLDEITNDCHLAIKYIKENADLYHISKNRLGIWGASAGGYLAGYLAANPNVGNDLKAAVLYYPAGYDYLNSYNDVVRQMLPSLNISDHKLDSLSIKNYISEKMPPTLIMYGELDQAFITEPSEAIYNDLIKNNVLTEKIVYENVGHVWLNKEGKYNSEIGDKAMKHLVNWFLKYL